MKSQTIFKTCVCPVCGKKFLPAPAHVYKDQRSWKHKARMVCSWGCVVKSERLKAEAKKKSEGQVKKG